MGKTGRLDVEIERFWLIILTVLISAFLFNGSLLAQESSNVTVLMQVPLSFKQEAWAVHREMITGEVGKGLEGFIKDSVSGGENELVINKLIGSEEFKFHSARIDTGYVSMPEGSFMTAYVAFRDIHYVGNNTFHLFKVNIIFSLDRKTGHVLGRTIRLTEALVPSRARWERWDWN